MRKPDGSYITLREAYGSMVEAHIYKDNELYEEISYRTGISLEEVKELMNSMFYSNKLMMKYGGISPIGFYSYNSFSIGYDFRYVEGMSRLLIPRYRSGDIILRHLKWLKSIAYRLRRIQNGDYKYNGKKKEYIESLLLLYGDLIDELLKDIKDEEINTFYEFKQKAKKS